ncbi:MAG TPA: hypothetical protein VFK40_07650 [Nitrososphaeraceae archaeon]|nr:hypothetical protein [Nitrososphaeraceae archaeon]
MISVINPKPCNYGCGTRIYWDTVSNSFLEVLTKQKHICKNRNIKSSGNLPKDNTNRPYYYNKITKQQPKPKMSNSLELLSGTIDSVQKKYEILSDIVTKYNGEVHGSQSHVNGNNISLVVYYEVPVGQRDEVKRNFDNFVRNSLVLLKY